MATIMDAKQITERMRRTLQAEQEQLRVDFLNDLRRLSREAADRAQQVSYELPTLAFLESLMDRLRELQAAYIKSELVREVLRQVEVAADVERLTMGSPA
jgi:hypothetical protein